MNDWRPRGWKRRINSTRINLDPNLDGLIPIEEAYSMRVKQIPVVMHVRSAYRHTGTTDISTGILAPPTLVPAYWHHRATPKDERHVLHQASAKSDSFWHV
jgi:hypothetical protein